VEARISFAIGVFFFLPAIPKWEFLDLWCCDESCGELERWKKTGARQTDLASDGCRGQFWVCLCLCCFWGEGLWVERKSLCLQDG
jgi:hypothetical protein